MSEQSSDGQEQQIVVIGPDGQPVATMPASADSDKEGDSDDDAERSPTDLVEQPAKVMRIGSMIRQLLEEVKAAPLDEASRERLAAIHERSVVALAQAMSPD